MRRHHSFIIVLLLVGAFALAGIVETRRAAADDVRVTFFDVGQGDSALIRARDGRTLLIDGGPDEAVLGGLSAAVPFWDRSLDVVLVTHLDTDHFAGLFHVLKKYRVGEVWWTGVAPTTATARRFVQDVAARGIPQRFVRAGERLTFDGAEFEVISPIGDLHGLVPPKPLKDATGGTNDFGIVGRLDCGAHEALFAADVSSAVEAELVASGAEIDAELLKVGHHGSRHSTSEAFLEAVHPSDAVISSGEGNRYGHPTPRILGALATRDVRIRRTDLEGDVAYACRGGLLRPVRARPWWRP